MTAITATAMPALVYIEVGRKSLLSAPGCRLGSAEVGAAGSMVDELTLDAVAVLHQPSLQRVQECLPGMESSRAATQFVAF